jgi:2-polyprenyl-3-methyl-5-hydroxy-6-metoxy-1,4-benzoquinol methylase
MALISIPCDLCGGSDFELLHPGTLPRLAQDDPARYYSSSRQAAAHLDIVRCRGCGLVMTNPRDDAATLQTVYSLLQDPLYEAESDNRRRTAIDHLRLLQGLTRPPGCLLDIGCATGIFLAEAQSAGWQVSGVEPSAWYAAAAGQRLPGVDIRQATLEQVDFPHDSFDVITLWDVLEHVDSPIRSLERIRPWLRPSGVLALNLPNIVSFSARVLGGRWPLLLREHLWYFAPATMERLLRQAGFTMLKTGPNWVHFSLNNIFKRLAQYPQTAFIDRRLAPSSSLRRLSLRFPMGEMRVLAVKR